jgi:hypothetical protein
LRVWLACPIKGHVEVLTDLSCWGHFGPLWRLISMELCIFTTSSDQVHIHSLSSRKPSKPCVWSVVDDLLGFVQAKVCSEMHRSTGQPCSAINDSAQTTSTSSIVQRGVRSNCKYQHQGQTDLLHRTINATSICPQSLQHLLLASENSRNKNSEAASIRRREALAVGRSR